MAAKISDRALLKVIREYMDADEICEQTEPDLAGPSEIDRAACHFAWDEAPA